MTYRRYLKSRIAILSAPLNGVLLVLNQESVEQNKRLAEYLGRDDLVVRTIDNHQKIYGERPSSIVIDELPQCDIFKAPAFEEMFCRAWKKYEERRQCK